MEKIWGLFGVGDFAVEFIIPSILKVATVKAIASRNSKKANRLSHQFGLPIAYNSYEDLLNDNEITHVYVGVPNSEHLKWCKKAIQLGKVVLCEKPFAVSTNELNQFWTTYQDADLKGRLFVGWMYRHHPRWEKAFEIISNGDIGDIQYINYNYSNLDSGSNDRRSKFELAGNTPIGFR